MKTNNYRYDKASTEKELQEMAEGMSPDELSGFILDLLDIWYRFELREDDLRGPVVDVLWCDDQAGWVWEQTVPATATWQTTFLVQRLESLTTVLIASRTPAMREALFDYLFLNQIAAMFKPGALFKMYGFEWVEVEPGKYAVGMKDDWAPDSKWWVEEDKR